MSDAVTVTDEMVDSMWNALTGATPVGAGDGGTYAVLPPTKARVRRELEELFATQPQDQRIAELEAEVERLNRLAGDEQMYSHMAIERVKELEAALQPFAQQHVLEPYLDSTPVDCCFSAGELRKAKEVFSRTPPQAKSKRDGEVLALKEALEARIKADAKLTHTMQRYIMPAVERTPVSDNEFISATIEHLDGPTQRHNDGLALRVLNSSTQAAQDAEDAEDAIREDERAKCAKWHDGEAESADLLARGYPLHSEARQHHYQRKHEHEMSATAIRSLSSKGEG